MQIGFAEVDITPDPGIELCGYGYYLGRKSSEIMDNLYARAVAFVQEDRACLLINCDLIGLTSETVRTVKRTLTARCGIKETDCLLVVTHTHSGPATTFLRGCGRMDDNYMNSLAGMIAGAVSSQ